MKIKWGALVVDGRGKIGGHVASKNREGAYLRTKVSPVNPQTTHQQTARSLLANFSQGWRGLTQAQRDAWNSAVESWKSTNVFADIVTPTGKNLFTKLNVNLSNIGKATINTPPLPVEVVEPVINEVDSKSGGLTVEVADGSVVTGQSMLVFATEPVSPGKDFVKNLYRMLGVVVFTDATPVDIGTQYTARFGPIPLGQKVCVKLVPVVDTTGQKGVGTSACAIAG